MRWRKGLCCSLQPGSESAASWSLQGSPGPAHPTAGSIPSAPILPQQPHPGQAGSAPRLVAGSVRLQRAFIPPRGDLEGLSFHWLSLPVFPTCTKEKQNHILISGPKHQWLSYSYSFPEVDFCLSQMHNIFVPWLLMGLLWSFNWVIFIKFLLYAWHVVRAREVFLKEISHRDR